MAAAAGNLQTFQNQTISALKNNASISQIQDLTTRVHSIKIEVLAKGSTPPTNYEHSRTFNFQMSYSSIPRQTSDQIAFFRQVLAKDLPATSYSKCVTARRSIFEIVVEQLALIKFTPVEAHNKATHRNMKEALEQPLVGTGLSIADYISMVEAQARASNINIPSTPSSDKEWFDRTNELLPTIILQNASNFPGPEQAMYVQLRQNGLASMIDEEKKNQQNMVLNQVSEVFLGIQQQERVDRNIRNLNSFKMTVEYTPSGKERATLTVTYP